MSIREEVINQAELARDLKISPFNLNNIFHFKMYLFRRL